MPLPAAARAKNGRGLCDKHYRRAQKHGDPQTVQRAGRPPDPLRTKARELFPEWSDRTCARYWWAMQTLNRLVSPDEVRAVRAVAALATGPNGRSGGLNPITPSWAAAAPEL